MALGRAVAGCVPASTLQQLDLCSKGIILLFKKEYLFVKILKLSPSRLFKNVVKNRSEFAKFWNSSKLDRALRLTTLINTSSAECAAGVDGHQDGVVTKRTASSRWNGADGGGHTCGHRHRIGFLLCVPTHISSSRRVRCHLLTPLMPKVSSSPRSTLAGHIVLDYI